MPLRYLLGFLPVIDIRSVLESEITDAGELRALERAWTKAVHLHLVLWTGLTLGMPSGNGFGTGSGSGNNY